MITTILFGFVAHILGVLLRPVYEKYGAALFGK